jgi:hypothetical protein
MNYKLASKNYENAQVIMPLIVVQPFQLGGIREWSSSPYSVTEMTELPQLLFMLMQNFNRCFSSVELCLQDAQY